MNAPSAPPRHLLCVANFPTNTGFAWSFIEGLYAGLADRLIHRGIQTWVAYPVMEDTPRSLRGSAARPVVHPMDLSSPRSVLATAALIRKLNAGLLYLSDRPSWHPAYTLFRTAGVRTVVVHDHTSGLRTTPRGLKRILKRGRHALPGSLADRVVTVSDFVARRKLEIDLMPPDRVTRIWNSVVTPEKKGPTSELRSRFGLVDEGRIVACASRASPEKGIHHLLRAFDQLVARWSGPLPPPWLVYLGDGPSLGDLRSQAEELPSGNRIRMPGYVEDAADVLGGADISVVPSTWAEAFGLAALEPMSRGVPVVASRVGGLPEVVRDGVDGVLVPPGDEEALTQALLRALEDDVLRAGMGQMARERARSTFSREEQLDRLARIFEGDVA